MILKQIGILHTPYKNKEDAPAQGYNSEEISIIEVFEEYAEGLLFMENREKLLVIYFGDRADRNILKSKNRGGLVETGVFVTRSPNRPNPLAICNVKILEIDGRFIKVTGLDALDGSPLIDIKGYLEPIIK